MTIIKCFCFTYFRTIFLVFSFCFEFFFTAFTKLMVDLRDGFLRELDRESSGLDGHINHFDRVLHVLD